MSSNADLLLSLSFPWLLALVVLDCALTCQKSKIKIVIFIFIFYWVKLHEINGG